MLNSVALYNLSQNTAASVSIQTGLKAIGRPCAVVLDNGIDSNTKKYAATKELLYQLLCFGLYFAIIPVFNRGAYNIAKKMYKDNTLFKLFDSPKSFREFHKLPAEQKMPNVRELAKEKNIDLLKKSDDTFKKEESLVNGSLEMGALVGSIVGLSIFAPMITNPLIRPVLEKMGLNKDKSSDKKGNVEKK